MQCSLREEKRMITKWRLHTRNLLDHSLLTEQLGDKGMEQKVGEKILVVDDNTKFRKVLCAFLESWGYQPVTASSGVEALSRLKEEKGVALVLLDVLMPGTDGIETLRRILESNSTLPRHVGDQRAIRIA